MSEAIEQVTEEEANPYNSRKDWHVEDAPSRGDATGIFFEEKPKAQATREAAPEEAEGTPEKKNQL